MRTSNQAVSKYGAGTEYASPVTVYPSPNGRVELKDNGKWDYTDAAVTNQGMPVQDINAEGSNSNPFLSNLRQPGNFDFNHVPIDFPETYDIAGPLANIFAVTMTAIVTGGVGAELGAAGYGVKELGGFMWRGAKAYHSTFGVNGGYASMSMELTNQTVTQLVQNGGVSLYDYDLLGLGTSAILKGNTPLKYQMLQGASGGIATFTINDGFRSPILQDPKAYSTATMLNGILSPLMGEVPLIPGKSGEVVNEIITGGAQGGVEKVNDYDK